MKTPFDYRSYNDIKENGLKQVKIREFFYRQVPLFLIFLLGFFLFFYKVGDRDLWAPDEDEYAQVSREMVQLNHWVYPTVNNQPYTIKPILYNWLIALVSLPWGDVNEFRARIVSSVSALGVLLTVFYLGTLMFSVRAGLLASLVLGTSILFLQFSRWSQIYMLSTFFTTLALFLFYRGYTSTEKRKVSYLLMYIPIGLGMLNMGLVSVVIPALVIGTFLLLSKDLKHFKELKPGWGIVILLLIATPWYLVVSMKGDYAFSLLVQTNFIRYFDTWVHRNPFYYYLVNLPWCISPWGLFLPGALHLAFSGRSKEQRRDMHFLLGWIVSTLLFFSLSQCKRHPYILPLYPAVSLLIAFLGDKAISNWKSRYFQNALIVPSLFFLSFLFLSALGLPLYSWVFRKSWFWEATGISIILGVVGIILLVGWRRKRPLLLIASPGLLMLCLVPYAVHFVIPELEAYNSPRPFCRQIVTELENGGQWAMYNHFRPTYVYYTGRFCRVLRDGEELRKFLWQNQHNVVAIKNNDYRYLKEWLGIKTRVLYRGKVGHRSMILITSDRKRLS